MPPKQAPGPPFDKNERVFCFHQNLLYEAKVIDIKAAEDEGWQYKVHYKGWKDRHDEWAPQDRLRKFNDENKELASQIKAQYSTHTTKSTAKQTKAKLPGKVQGSELGSTRGSEERMPTATQSGRGPRRARDYELEPVSVRFFFFV